MKSQKVKFPNESGIELSGLVDLPLGINPKAFVLFAHCFTCSKTLKAVDNISRALTSKGFGVLRFDFTGLGQSKGDFADSNFTMNITDLVSAYNFLETNFQAPSILMGHSLGGAAALHSASRMDKVKAVVTVGAPSNPIHVRHLIEGAESEIDEKGEAKVNIGGRPFHIKKQFIDDLEKNSMKDVIGAIKRALLVIHSPQDNIVGIENAAEIYTAAKHPKSFISLDGADHLMSKEADSRYVGEVVASWTKRYIDAEIHVEDQQSVRIDLDTAEFLCAVEAGKHQLLADEPEDAGGRDLGPNPYQYLLTALGACTAMTLKMYADFKKIELKNVEVYLTQEKIYAKDCEECASDQEGKIDQIKREIVLEGDLTDEQRKRMIEIADRCPVHKTIEGKPEILTSERVE